MKLGDEATLEVATMPEAIADIGTGLLALAANVSKQQVRRSLQPGQWTIGVADIGAVDAEHVHLCLAAVDGTEEIWWRLTRSEAHQLSAQLAPPPSKLVLPGR